jgi:2-polyprenyl-3-methyl-5-hydroxy-6-metoxy-1,4-benzoquinol methylase
VRFNLGRQEIRRRQAPAFLKQLRLTLSPFLPRPLEQCRVLDVGCGWGHLALELARVGCDVVGIDPSDEMLALARATARDEGLENARFRCEALESLAEREAYDLAVLDNVFEHMADQAGSLRALERSLRPGGVAFLIVPNKIWPLEVHYHLPFLSYLPLPLANRYLRLTRRGTDYRDASYAPSYLGLCRLLRRFPAFEFRFTVPGDVTLALGGRSWRYRWGAAALRRFPALWAVSKTLVVVLIKRAARAADAPPQSSGAFPAPGS